MPVLSERRRKNVVVALVERAAVHANIMYSDGSISGQRIYRTVF